MQSFIVRIYRFRTDSQDQVVGTIQGIESKRQESFKGVEQLWAALNRFSLDEEPNEKSSD